MSAPSTPSFMIYKTLRDAAALQLGLDPASLTTLDKQRLALFLTDGAEWAYRPGNKAVLWPESLSTATVTLSSGAFNISYVDYSNRFVLWSTDPAVPGTTAYPVSATRRGALVYPDTTAGDVFAIYIPRPPQFSSTVAAVSTAYVTGDVVWDDTARSGGSGQCYRYVGAGYTSSSSNATLTTELADTTKWVTQEIITYLAPAILAKGCASWFTAVASEGRAAVQEADAAYYRDVAWQEVEPMVATGAYTRWFSQGVWRS